MKAWYDSEKNNVNNEKIWSGIERFLYLINHSRPNIANATQELLEVIDGVNQAAFLEMHWVI